eukprot:TRINITY_DN1230_c0_g1_i1.p1 TRINITY_DN1230_c0_g1~~TRINITY_DN1230_c0_g1_i1.p1  ORF type:complete len:484 (+),score=80.75 TRINITY_DN1230_c0_g1_i1:315-1766(+)
MEDKRVEIANYDPRDIPTLKHGLETVLFEKGLHISENKHSKKTSEYNKRINGKASHIVQPHEIDMELVNDFVTSSTDPVLRELASEHKCKFTGSTSSVSGLLTNLYFLITRRYQVSTGALKSFDDIRVKFSGATNKPENVNLRWNGDHYSIDTIPEKNVSNRILLELGKTMEKQLTMNLDEFKKLRIGYEGTPADIPQEQYHYKKMYDILLRSQLDCYDEKLGKTFDLKTRANRSIRFNIEEYASYITHIDKILGRHRSFETEFFDLVKSGLIKYLFQAKIGEMGGIFIAHHNTQTIFGYEYIPISIMEEILFETSELSDYCFTAINGLLSNLLNRIVSDIPKQSLGLTVKMDKMYNSLDIFVREIITDVGWNEEGIDCEYGKFHKYNLNLMHLIKGEPVPIIVMSKKTNTKDLDIYYQITKSDKDSVAILDEWESVILRYKKLHSRGGKNKRTGTKQFSGWDDIFGSPPNKVHSFRTRNDNL